MAIDLEWQDENGNCLARYDGPKIDLKVWSIFFQRSATCLRSIDPFGDTVFDQSKMKILVAELDQLLIPAPGGTPPAVLVAVREFVHRAMGKAGSLLIFIGD